MVNEQLIKKCIKGVKSAQRTLYLNYAKKMFVVSYRYTNQKEDAEEIVSEGFIKIFQNLSKIVYHDEVRLQAWMKKIIVNECLMFLRKKKRMIYDEHEVRFLETRPEVESTLALKDTLKAILSLPVGYRTVFNLYVIEGYSHKEIAQKLNIAESTSRSQLTKAKTMLQSRIAKTNL
ncbi:sigma-70 family RNA polymerase sigma factor [uncultured Croceitalea sp.]|uniref:RNA polymerase sigma factor n=1 Tax=uncultured Croceitalea sp. TaxID=1798908 RepID=UPI0033056EF3